MDAVLASLRAHPYGRAAVAVGEVSAATATAAVELVDGDTRRRLAELRGAELPRLC